MHVWCEAGVKGARLVIAEGWLQSTSEVAGWRPGLLPLSAVAVAQWGCIYVCDGLSGLPVRQAGPASACH